MSSRKSNILLFFIAILLCSNSLLAQENKTSLKLIARALPDSILLRWAPTNFVGWNAGNKYGYTLVRYTIMRNGNLLPQPQPEILSTEPLKPWPLEAWEKLTDTDDYAAIAAQAIYGETFEIHSKKAMGILDVVNKAQEQESRFSFSLFAVDQSREAARAAGLWYTDRHVKKGEKYLYRVFMAAPQNIVVSDTAVAYTGVDESLPLPKPMNFRAEFGDKSVILHWNRKVLNNFYNSYSLERSEDGQTFHNLRNKPFVYTQSADFKESDEMMFTDSITENAKQYSYRLVGHTAFGELGPYSDVQKGSGITELKTIPDITKSVEVSGTLNIKWNFPEAENVNIRGFKLVRSNNDITNFDTITTLLPPATREYTDIKPRPTNYYKVVVFAKSGTVKTSLASLIQLSDTIPPAPPVGLKAVADTSGKLVLSWKPNTEDDIYGYRIFRANALHEEFSQITVAPIRDTVFIDQINLKTTTKTIYYQLTAIDKRQNHSELSQPLEVERPDIVPPASAAISDIQSTPKGVCLKWFNSSSSDVVKHLIYRRAKADAKPIVIKEIAIADTSQQYTDLSALEGMVYYYSIVAQDKSGLKSTPTVEMAGQMMASAESLGVKDFRCDMDRKNQTLCLRWKSPKDKVSRYVIYRKKGENGVMEAYAPLSGDKTEFTDTKIKNDTKYSYCIIVFYANGNSSSGTDCLDVNF